ncbi:endonuclease/exonuclease/phosphatase family protein [Streptomyces boncukensis]|uniref:Endonuclease/exonuclease/phosphatase family protein n=1 Tax=Streptomyces boncukensis TaxID=2711219 RepID=A0A6G4X6Q6_9ACTN|nr:endonuclease/exonuclease/phosphatase family protein [Streptomyces boncukensis]NGO73068.1 endonuclease/exonuclease/phosphatase family protein [Streptomyces boncukensis]
MRDLRSIRGIRIGSASALAAALIATGGILSPAAAEGEPAENAAAENIIGSFNMAGGHSEHGPKGNEAADALVRSVEDRKPAVMLLQEACEKWKDRLQEKLEPEYDLVFHQITGSDGTPATCKGGNSPFGLAVLYRTDLEFDKDTKKAHRLTTSGGLERREMLCVKSPSRDIAACTTHLTPGDEDREKESRFDEAAQASHVLNRDYAADTVLLGGDMNDTPWSLALGSFYHKDYGAFGALKAADSPCGNVMSVFRWVEGRFTLCRSGKATHGDEKIDYLFVSPRVTVTDTFVGEPHHSDHRLLWSKVLL